MQEGNLIAALQDLRKREIQFVLVGGLAAALHGAPVQTYDVDLVYSREAENVGRLLKFLAETDAIFRIQPERRLRPNKSHLMGSGNLNLLTRYGPVDLLATIGQGLDFSALLPRSTEMKIGEGIGVRVLDLETIIALKEQLASEKDLAALPILRRTLSEMKKKKI